MSPSAAVQKKRQQEQQLLDILLQNPELDLESARNELGWIAKETREAMSTSSHPTELPSKSNSPHVDREAHLDNQIHSLVCRRGRGEPLQYVLGNTDFGPLLMDCRAPVLIPRPETATVFGQLADLFCQTLSHHSDIHLEVLDLYTGSGAIALLMEHQLGPLVTSYQGHGVDVHPRAVQLARTNGVKNGLTRTRFVQANVMHPSFPGCDVTMASPSNTRSNTLRLVTANPPYISYDEYIDLPESVRAYEDMEALYGDGVRGEPLATRQRGLGTSHYHRLASLLPRLATVPCSEQLQGRLPIVAVEIGHGQADEVKTIFETESGGMVRRTECWRDEFGKDRMVVGWATDLST